MADPGLTVSYVYFPGADEGGAGEPFMTEAHHGSIVIYGGVVLTNDYKGEQPIALAVRRENGLWYQDEGDRLGRPFIIIESQPCEHTEGQHP